MVYNNSSYRDNQKISSANLKNRLSQNIIDFYLLVNNYKAGHDSGDYDVIIENISRKSEFSAFKRMIVRCDPELFYDFENALR